MVLDKFLGRGGENQGAPLSRLAPMSRRVGLKDPSLVPSNDVFEKLLTLLAEDQRFIDTDPHGFVRIMWFVWQPILR